MRAAERLNGMMKVLLLGLLVATFVLAPASVVPVIADGGSNGQPGPPPTDSTLHGYIVDDPVVAPETLDTVSQILTALRFVEL